MYPPIYAYMRARMYAIRQSYDHLQHSGLRRMTS